MEKTNIPLDDIDDVKEMTKKLEDSMCEILSENEITLAISALVSATVNFVIHQSASIDEIEHYQTVFMKVFKIGKEAYKRGHFSK
jgi:hypothetical protein